MIARGSSQDDLLEAQSLAALLSDVSADETLAADFGAGDSLSVQHGSSLVLLGTSREAALTALRSIEWEADSTDWRRAQLKRCQRWIVRGSTFSTHRKPRNKSLPMAQFNVMWKTHLYSLVVEDNDGKIALTFHGVRRQDVETALQGKMGLDSDD